MALGAHEALYRANAGTPSLVQVPSARFISIDGTGSPDGEDFQAAVGALYALAYAAKFALEKTGGRNVKVPPLEGLYSADADAADFDTAARERLAWTLMLRLPEALDAEVVEAARAQAAKKRPLPALDRVRIEQFDEGPCAQLLHVGPYATETATVAALHAFIHEQGREPRGRHHEIYLSDPRRTAPEHIRTIIRQPVTDVDA